MHRIINRELAAVALSARLTAAAYAQKTYSRGVSDTQIKLGQSTPLSGRASAFGAGAGRAVVGYFEMLNAKGGFNGTWRDLGPSPQMAASTKNLERATVSLKRP